MTASPAVRVGVDVGGTFTKAVAVDATGIVAQSVIATTHEHPNGVAEGVVRAVADVAASLDGRPIALVTHSTTQAVNALLEGDVGTVGVIGMGRRPDLRKSRKRTTLDHVELAPGKQLRTLCEFVDVSDGLDRGEIKRIVEGFVAAGASPRASPRRSRPRTRRTKRWSPRSPRPSVSRCAPRRRCRACTAWNSALSPRRSTPPFSRSRCGPPTSWPPVSPLRGSTPP
ncbi:MAG: hydantoinase/oxoprolinase N-terminal domain-containing protein [Microthrixaceae bacterium]